MKDFIKKHLTSVKTATKKQSQKEFWDVQGILKNRLNQKLKYDLRPNVKHSLGEHGFIKTGKNLTSKSRADKIVFEESDHWVIVEALELHNFVRMHQLKEINLEEIIKVLEWNIKILK